MLFRLLFQMQWLAVVMCLCAGVASARTEEDQASASSSNGVSSALPERCFHEQQSECPSIGNGECPCKRIVLSHNSPDANAVLCCNLDSQSFEAGLACASEFDTQLAQKKKISIADKTRETLINFYIFIFILFINFYF